MYKKILVPLDGSERAEAILPHVKELASLHKSHLVFMQVVEPPILVRPLVQPNVLLYQNEWDRRTEAAEMYLKRLEDRYQNEGFEVSIEIQYGPVVDVIVEAAERHKTDLIAIASHGRSGLARVFYGSVTAGILQRADRPLLVVRSETS